MSESNIKRASLEEIQAKIVSGELTLGPGGEAVDLGPDFWREAELVDYSTPATSVHLRLDPEVFAFFKAQGKGHLTRMQNVLKAYVKAQSGSG
ncbi:MAG: hypothetical protein JWR75_1298 [Devosia sp.]|nr:hypothetical protein [Devosia sp.]